MPGISTWITRATWIYADLKHGNARSPGTAHLTPLSCQFCATQCKLRCNAACQTRTKCGSARETQASARPETKAESLFDSGKDPPFRGRGLETPELFGVAASIAAR